MKKLLIIACLLSLTAIAADKPKKQLTPEEKAARRELMMQRTGGPFTIPAQGFVAMVDLQKRANYEKTSAKFIETFSGFGIAAKPMKTEGTFTVKDLTTKRAELGAGSVVFIIDDPAYPMTLLSMETRSAVVNVAALATDNPSPALLTRRTCKMIGRISMLASGGAETASPTCDLQPVTNLKDLDMNEGKGAEAYVMMGVINGLNKAGVTPPRRTSYLQACKLGVATPPTNQYQKVIWDKVHATPKNPLKIEFDPKKGR